MPLVAYALTTVARQKAFLGITVSSYDSLLESLINSVTEWVEGYCDRRFKRTAYTQELYDGRGHADLLLKNYPVVAGETFTLEQRGGSDNVSSFSTISSNLYFVKNAQGIIHLASGIFLDIPQLYRVTYTAGYAFDNAGGATAESVGLGDLEYVVWKLVGTAFAERKNSANIQSESIGDYSGTFRKQAEGSEELKASLSRYRRPYLA